MKNLPLIAIIALIAIIPAPAAGFGKNKVQYQYMDWRYLEAPHYTLYFHQDQGTLPETSYPWLDEIYGDLSSRFGFVHRKPVPVIVYESPAQFAQTNIITELLPEEVGGFTEIFKNRIAVPFNGSFADLRHVLHHEMVHAFMFGAMLDGGSVLRAAGAQVPLWFSEGLAEVLSSGWNREADMYMLDRVLNSFVPPPGPMLSNGYIAYKGGQSFMYYLYTTGGDSLFNAMLQDFRKTKDAEKSIETVYNAKLEELGKEWTRELRRIYWPEIGRRIEPSSHARAITDNAKDRSNFNLRPRVSPDGSRIAFFSDKKNYTRIIIADTSGKEILQIGQHGIGESFESFQPMSGAIAWSPDGGELAFVARKGGRGEVVIVQTKKRGRRTRSIRLNLSSITGLDWSRDGRYLAMTAIANGTTDLYTYDLTSSRLTRLTNSAESKSSPRFSPNGKTIAFTAADTAGLAKGPLTSIEPRPASNIALYDIENGRYELLTNTVWNEKQPAFSPDGKSILYVSDENGIDNLYVAPIDDPYDARALTDYAGNCGNPDWAADGSAIVFDLFANQAWNVWRVEDPLEKLLEDGDLAKTVWAEHEEDPSKPFFRKRAGTKKNPVTTRTAKDTAAAKTKPDSAAAGIDVTNVDAGSIDADTAEIYTYHPHGNNGLALKPHKDFVPAGAPPAPSPYKLRFTPDLFIIGMGINTYSGASGQALAQFSDLMGDHRITAIGDMQMNFSDYARIFAAYSYLKMRVDLTGGGFYYKYYSYNGRFRQYYHDMRTGAIAGASYPFSMFSRVDLQALGSYIERVPLTGDDSTTLVSNELFTSLGFTYDNILWGITGPLKGTRARARLQVSPPISSIEEAYLSGDIDIRHYAHIFKRFVWANRLTFGGSIPLDGDRSARRFMLGGDVNWFNYNVNIDNYDDNLAYSNYSEIVAPMRGWNYFDLTGDRMMLMNSEWRFPFIREISTVWPLPMQLRYINGAFFVDGGYAWTREEQDGDLPIPPKLIGGWGFGMRANLGIFVLRYDRGWPLGPGKGGPINYYSLGAEF